MRSCCRSTSTRPLLTCCPHGLLTEDDGGCGNRPLKKRLILRLTSYPVNRYRSTRTSIAPYDIHRFGGKAITVVMAVSIPPHAGSSWYATPAPHFCVRLPSRLPPPLLRSNITSHSRHRTHARMMPVWRSRWTGPNATARCNLPHERRNRYRSRMTLCPSREGLRILTQWRLDDALSGQYCGSPAQHGLTRDVWRSVVH